METHLIDQPEFTYVRDEGTTEPKPTEPPNGFVPFVETKEGALSPEGQWRWTGNSWTKI